MAIEFYGQGGRLPWRRPSALSRTARQLDLVAMFEMLEGVARDKIIRQGVEAAAAAIYAHEAFHRMVAESTLGVEEARVTIAPFLDTIQHGLVSMSDETTQAMVVLVRHFRHEIGLP